MALINAIGWLDGWLAEWMDGWMSESMDEQLVKIASIYTLSSNNSATATYLLY